MKFRLLWKLLLVNLVVILCVVGITWWAVDILAADYFMVLMKKFNIEPKDSHQMFLQTVHRYLLWSSAVAALVAVLLSWLLIKQVLRPLQRMTRLSGRLAAGDFSVRVPVSGSDEVTSLSEAFNEMAASLAFIEGLRKKMVADVAHELRTPLTNMRGYLEGLLDGVVPPERDTFEVLHEQSMRLSRLVDDLLQLAKADSARANLQNQEVDYAQLWRGLAELWSPRLRDKGITLKLDLHPDGSRVWADPQKLTRILENLLENALRYAPAGDELGVQVAREGQWVQTALGNAAPQLPPASLPLLFERFYRGEKSRSREFGGAGIGLAIVKELVQAHGGHVDARLEEGRLFISFTLPATAQ